ncbi:hypothetical protein B9Z55_025772 [Caenorhabditis nigoni]|nr:hypothetical protein B9Z55_025772 [Caenorhabditis nigoni]
MTHLETIRSLLVATPIQIVISEAENFDWFDVELIQQRVFPGLYQVIVFMDTSYVPYYKEPDVGKGKELYILLQDGHYEIFRTLPRLFKTKYYCELCTTGYGHTCAHYNCPKIHRICGKEGCKPKAGDVKMVCDKCEIEFPSQECYENHKRKGPMDGKSRCDSTVFCKRCKKSYYRNKNSRPHVCGEVLCHRCECPRAAEQHCSMMPTKKKDNKITHRRIFFDIESRSIPETGLQVPHAVYQAWMYHQYKNCRSPANRKKYSSSIEKTDNQNRHKKVHDAVKAMKEDKVFHGLYQIIVFMDTSYVPYYNGPDVGKGKELYILLQDGHYQGFRTLPGLFKTKYCCELCSTGYGNTCSHYNCPKIHWICGKEGCKPKAGDVKVVYEQCKIEFPSEDCFENHKCKGQKVGRADVIFSIKNHITATKMPDLTFAEKSSVTGISVRELPSITTLYDADGEEREQAHAQKELL